MLKPSLSYMREALGSKVKLTRAHGSSDARFFAARGMPVIMLRPDGDGAHGDNEWISSDSIQKFYELLKAYILNTC
ncbi:MAG: M20/M25/M40 family metallo-hydrolase [Candidatus Saccharibacteria bacterium]